MPMMAPRGAPMMRPERPYAPRLDGGAYHHSHRYGGPPGMHGSGANDGRRREQSAWTQHENEGRVYVL